MNKLLPCPFCGNEKVNITWTTFFSTQWQVCCYSCGIIGPERESKNAVIELWNKRVVKEKKWTYEETQRKLEKTHQNMFSFSYYRDFQEQLNSIYFLSGWTEKELEKERIRRM